MSDLTAMSFRKIPFTRELDVTERFVLDFQQEAANAIHETVNRRMSASLVAPAGTGKTVVLRLLTSLLPEARFRVRYVKVTGLSKRDLCKEIAVACGLEPAGIYPTLVRHLEEHCLQLSSADGLRTVLLIDEAHDLRPESLAILRLLTNFAMDSKLVLSIVLAGQPPLGGGCCNAPATRPWPNDWPIGPRCASSPETNVAPTSNTAVASPVPHRSPWTPTPSRQSTRCLAATSAIGKILVHLGLDAKVPMLERARPPPSWDVA